MNWTPKPFKGVLANAVEFKAAGTYPSPPFSADPEIRRIYGLPMPADLAIRSLVITTGATCYEERVG